MCFACIFNLQLNSCIPDESRGYLGFGMVMPQSLLLLAFPYQTTGDLVMVKLETYLHILAWYRITYYPVVHIYNMYMSPMNMQIFDHFLQGHGRL